MGKPRNLTDILDATFGAMVRAVDRGEAATMGEAYERLEAEMNESRPDLTTRLVEALRESVERRAPELLTVPCLPSAGYECCHCDKSAATAEEIDHADGCSYERDVALLAEAAARPEVAPRHDCHAALLERTPEGTRLAYLHGDQVIVTGTPPRDEHLPEEERHNCDAMGCSSVSHVVERRSLAPMPVASTPPALPEEVRAAIRRDALEEAARAIEESCPDKSDGERCGLCGGDADRIRALAAQPAADAGVESQNGRSPVPCCYAQDRRLPFHSPDCNGGDAPPAAGKDGGA